MDFKQENILKMNNKKKIAIAVFSVAIIVFLLYVWSEFLHPAYRRNKNYKQAVKYESEGLYEKAYRTIIKIPSAYLSGKKSRSKYNDAYVRISKEYAPIAYERALQYEADGEYYSAYLQFIAYMQNDELYKEAYERIKRKAEAKIETDDNGTYFKTTYWQFVEKLKKAITYAAGGNTEDVNSIATTCHNISASISTIPEYHGDVNYREIVISTSNVNGFIIKEFYMEVYTEPQTDYIVKLVIQKNNMKRKPDSDRENALSRFNALANGVTSTLSGEQISYLNDYEIKTEDNTTESIHYIIYNDCEMIFTQQNVMFGDFRKLEIYPVASE